MPLNKPQTPPFFTWILVLSATLLGTRAAAAQASLATSSSGAPRAGYAVVAAEFMTPTEIEAALPLLASRGVGVVLDWPSTELAEGNARYALVRRANARGVEVRPWLLLPREQGYWPNSTNAREFDRAARLLADNWLAAGLAPATFVIDMEMPLARAQRFADLAVALDLGGLTSFMREGINRTQYAEATRIYRELVDYLHGRGFRVELSTLTQVLDDYADFDDGLRQAMNIPVAGIAWDVCTFQLYRTLNSFVLGGTLGPTTSYYVFDYARIARQLFGGRAGVGIGMTDPGDLAPTAPSYTSPTQLREDIDAASLAGIARQNIGLYNLRGIVRRAPSTDWFPARSAFIFPPLPDLPTALTHTTSRTLDLAL
jgi:hypothetical protein